MPTQNKKIAVVGSGFGGLSAAIRLQNMGFQVSLFEKRDQPGGRAYVYKDKGFTFDAGPTVITAPECLQELFEISGKKIEDYIELMSVTPFYKLFWDDGYIFDYSNDPETLKKQILTKNPKDWEGYQKFLSYSEKVFNEGYTKLAAKPFLNFSSMVKVAPQLALLRADQSVYQRVSKFISDPHLRQAFSFHSLLVGGNPFKTSSIYTLIHFLERKWGVFFPKGGTGALVKALVKLFEDLGGKLYLECPVKNINKLDDGSFDVTCTEKATENFRAVVSNADIIHTYDKLFKNNKNAQKSSIKLKKSKFSMSLFLIYFGTKKKYPHLAHHNVIFGPRYKGLLDDIFKNGTLPDDFSLYLHTPSVTDPSLAPEGGECFYVLSPVAHLGNMKIDWEKEGPIYANKIMTYLERYIPDLKENIVTQRIFTPKDFETELNSFHGSAFSLEPTLRQSAYFRVHNEDDNIKNLYFVGAGTHPGAGLPGVINSAKATTELMRERLK